MKYSQFQKRLNQKVLGSGIISQTHCFGHIILETADEITIDGQDTTFSTINEARNFIKQQQMCNRIEREIQQEQYDNLPGNKVANIIKEHHSNVRVTDTLIESYVELAASKVFTADAVALEIRNLNKLDRLIESHVDFKLDDGTVIVISEGIQSLINNTFAGHLDVVNHMRLNKENFLSVLDQLED